jgi:4-hydroxyphenylpyruvate dioxygenase
VFNDHFRQAGTARTARDGMRSLLALEDSLYGAAHPAVPTGFAFAELADPEALGGMLTALGFQRTGTHPTKPVELWEQGGARLLLNAAGGDAALVAIGLDSPDPGAAVKHAESLLSPVLPRDRAPRVARLDAVAAPDGTQIFFCGTDWLDDFGPSGPVAGEITRIDHVALTQPFHYFDEAELFYRTVLGLRPQESLELPDPYGLLRSKAMSAAEGAVRMVINLAQVGARDLPWQHVALACDDVVAVARRLRAEHPELLLPIPANYYDDLEARHDDVDPELRELGVLYDRDAHGEFLHLYTVTVGRVFFELVQRTGGYQGYGAGNAPIRLSVQHAGPH